MRTPALFLLLAPLGWGFDPDLPPSLLPAFYNQYPGLRPAGWGGLPRCWGWEAGCPDPARPHCAGDFSGWAETKEEAEQVFFKQADFGFVRGQLDELTDYCGNSSSGTNKERREDESRSSLRCSAHLQFCEGEALLLDLRGLRDRVRTENLRYKMDVLGPGDIQVIK